MAANRWYLSGHRFRRRNGEWQRLAHGEDCWKTLHIEYGETKPASTRGDAVKGEFLAVQPSNNTWLWK